VLLQIFNIVGEEVARLVDSDQDAGEKSVEFSSGVLCSGIYFCKLTSDKFVQARKMLLLR
jgi:hypothetical protein